MTQPEKINYVIERGAEYFGATVKELTSHPQNGRRDQWSVGRMMIAHYLKNNTTLTLAKLADMLGYKNHTSAYYLGLRLTDSLGDRFGDDKTKKIYRELTEYIGL